MVFGVNCCLLASVPRFAGVTGLAAGRKVSLSFWISATNLSSVRWATLAAFLACFFACLFFSPGDVEEEDEEVEEGEGLRYFFFSCPDPSFFGYRRQPCEPIAAGHCYSHGGRRRAGICPAYGIVYVLSPRTATLSRTTGGWPGGLARPKLGCFCLQYPLPPLCLAAQARPAKSTKQHHH